MKRHRFSFRAAYIVHLVVALVLLCALINLWSAITPALPERITFLRGIFSPELRDVSRLAAAFSSFMLVLLARGLLGRKRMAWLITVIVLAVSVVAHLVKGFDVEEAALGSIALVALFITKGEFVARPDLPSLWSGLRVLLIAFLFTLFYGTIGFFFLDRQFGARFDLFASLKETVNMFLLSSWPAPHTRFARWFLGSIYLIAFSSFGIALIALLRSVILRHAPTMRDRARAKSIIETYGISSLSRFALLGEKHFFFGSEGESVIAYTVVRVVALALGDPIGPANAMEDIITGFSEFCRSNGWKPAFYQTAPEYSARYQARGFMLLPIGQTAVVAVKGFSIEGAANKEFRNVAHKFEKEGYRATYYPAPQTQERIRHLRTVSDEWLSEKNTTEKSFSLGTFTEDYIRSTSVMTVEDVRGTIFAFANVIEGYHKREMAIDLMRQRADVPAGTMLYLLLSLVLQAKERGYEFFNLGLAPLAGVGEAAEASRIEKILHVLFKRVHQPYNFEGLYAFKKKFRPLWETRYLVYPNATDTLSVLEAVTIADSSTSFWGEIRAELSRRISVD